MFKHPDPLAIKRLDHLGIVVGTIDEIGLVEKIDTLTPPAPQRLVSYGNAVKAMILNALGFVSRPLYSRVGRAPFEAQQRSELPVQVSLQAARAIQSHG